jgi:uncharacterized protein
MKRIALALSISMLLATGQLCARPALTVTGIPLDQPWKANIYELVTTKFIHPAWGWQHGERNYQIGAQIAKADNIRFDSDVLFAACMLHDMAAFAPYDKMHGEHGDVAALESEPILRDAGFPMEKFPNVAAAMRTHMYYSKVGNAPEAILLHDADSLDFLGTIGAVRILSLTGASAADASKAIEQLRGFVTAIPPKILTKTGRAMAKERAVELKTLLDSYEAESFGERLP